MQYGLIGERLVHSFSKDIHTKYFGLDYQLKELKKQEVENFINERNFKALNVTIPYKNVVIEYLDEISETAKKIGAVNTIVNDNRKLKGYNTDFLGLKLMLERMGLEFSGKNFLILGDGATSKTALAVAESLKCKTAVRVSRKKTEGTVSYQQALKLSDTQIIINTTPVGMYPNLDNTPIDIDAFENLEGVFDVVYNPLRSKLIITALNRGITACGGLYMLVAQAVFAASLFKNTEIEKEKIDFIYNDILNKKQNIVLVGMPSCGKTTVGKLLAKEIGFNFIDTDELIAQKYGEITQIFKNSGESGFRDRETEIIKEISNIQGSVIATGGGAVLRKENTDALKQNGKIYFLDRPLEKLITTPDRPLSQNKDSLKKLYNERYNIYNCCCDKKIISDNTPQDTVRSILDNENINN